MRFICGDIGGTNSRLQLWQQTIQYNPHQKLPATVSQDVKTLRNNNKQSFKLIFEQVYPSQQYDSIVTILKHFIQTHNKQQPSSQSSDCHNKSSVEDDERQNTNNNASSNSQSRCPYMNNSIRVCCLAVAGPVSGHQAKITNVNWNIDSRQIEQELSITKCSLINDFQGIGYGLLQLEASDLTIINEQTTIDNLNKPKSINHNGQPLAVIGAGTGLGQAYLTWNGHEYICHSSEGGHTDFGPRNKIEMEFLIDFWNHNPKLSHVSYERFVSGIGIPHIYRTLCRLYPTKINQIVFQQIQQSKNIGRDISVAAQRGTCQVCVMTLDHFMQMYGAETGNLVLKTLPKGGIYIAGGIAAKNLKIMLKNNQFYTNYKDKGRLSQQCTNIPIYYVGDKEIGLLGAKEIATRMMRPFTDAAAQQSNKCTRHNKITSKL